MQLTNVSFKPILFRIRTTAPHRYVVKPTKGVVFPNKTEMINIHLSDGAEGDGDQTITDEFCIVYCELADNETIAPKAANVPDLIKARQKSDLSKRIVKSFINVGAKVTQPAVATQNETVKQLRGDNPSNVRAPASPVQPPIATPASPIGSSLPLPKSAVKEQRSVVSRIVPALAVLILALFVSYFFNVFE